MLSDNRGFSLNSQRICKWKNILLLRIADKLWLFCTILGYTCRWQVLIQISNRSQLYFDFFFVTFPNVFDVPIGMGNAHKWPVGVE